MTVIEKGQQLAGHFPSTETMARARQVLTGEVTPEAARAEMHRALARIVAEERDATPNWHHRLRADQGTIIS